MGTLTIGLTGGIASGKSHIAARFIDLGVPLLEADDVARLVVTPGQPALAAIADRFGADVLQADGTLDRRRLRQQVFTDPVARRDLEAITHPAIRRHVASWHARQTTPYCIYSAAILVESGMTAQVARVLVVDAPEDQQLERLMTRDGVDEALARRMIAAQASRTARLGHADDIIDNGDTRRDPQTQILRLDRHYRDLAAHVGSS